MKVIKVKYPIDPELTSIEVLAYNKYGGIQIGTLENNHSREVIHCVTKENYGIRVLPNVVMYIQTEEIINHFEKHL